MLQMYQAYLQNVLQDMRKNNIEYIVKRRGESLVETG